jgi:hypothetical protein
MGGQNLYCYVTGQPCSYSDPLGSCPALAIPIAGALLDEILEAAVLTAAVAAAADAAEDLVDTAKKVLCRKRHPTWAKCPSGFTDDAMEAAMRAAPKPLPGDARIGPIRDKCIKSSEGYGCPGGAPGTWHVCLVEYRDPKTNTVGHVGWSVLCCKCCRWLRSGTYCESDHTAGFQPVFPQQMR